MTDRLTIWTYDWVPDGPRGFVRDLRLRWAMEEAGLDHDVKTVPFDDRGPEHIRRQPFAQAPFLTDGEIEIFESGACLLHLGEKSEALMPRDPKGRADTVQWVIAALNSVEMVTVPCWFIDLSKPDHNPLAGWMGQRFDRLEAVIQTRDWFAAGRFTIADLLMADVLRMPKRMGKLEGHPALSAYVERICGRPAFERAKAAQLAHFAAADESRRVS
jgi:glutathione S-transferase